MTRINKIFLGLAAATLLLLPACSDLAFDNGAGGKTGVSALTLLLTLDGMGPEIATRASVPAETGEENVDKLTLFFFEPSADRSGLLVDWVELDNPAMNAPNAIPTDGKAISASEAYRVIGVANAAGYMAGGWEETWRNRSEAEFRNGADASLPPSIASASLLMNGSAVKTAGNGLIEMKLTRNVARFDVECKAAGQSLVSAQLRNVYEISSVTGDGTMMNYASDNTADREGSSATIDAGGNPIKGKLYAFENRITAPVQGDKVTTCLIVELSNGGFYRINVHPEGEGQFIRRNKVYMVSINDVNGTGYSSADDAFDGTKEDELDYTINNWDLGDNGLIVSDSYSILALPVKTAQIGKEGATLTYNITTFTTLESASPLAIKGSPTLDAGLGVSLNGNILTVTATALDNDSQIREGSVTLTYAGLEATMNIVQSPKVESFLKLSYQAGWSGLLSASGNDETKEIYVNASGPYKATMIGDDGFSFDPDSYKTEIASSEISDNTFKVAVISPNPSKTSQRNAFVIVTLDSDPLNCVAVVSLTQAVASDIIIDPVVETVTFNGSKSVTIPDPESNVHTYTVFGTEMREVGEVIIEVPLVLSATITGDHSDRFGFSLTQLTEGDAGKYMLKIWTTGTNTSSSNYMGKLTIFSGGSELILNLIQRPLALSVAVTQPTTVGPEGGETGSFNLSIDDSDARCTVSVVTRGVGRDIFNHEVKLIYDESGEEVGLDDEFTANTKLKLVFPKIYFPNREIDIRATVTFTTTTGATATYTFTQNKLTTIGLRIWSTYVTRWGSLTPSGTLGYYMEHFNNYIRNNGAALSSPGTYSLIASSSASDYGNNVPAATNWYHFSNNDADIASEFMGVNTYYAANRGNRLTLLQAGHGALYSQLQSHFVGSTGYNFINSNEPVNRIRLNSDVSSTRVYKFIMEFGRKTIVNISGFGLYNDGVNGGTTTYPAGAVPLLQYVNSSGGFDGSYNLVIDPINNVVYHGDETVFYGSYYTNNSPVPAADKAAFMTNYIDYLSNAARYGSHFTDMLREDAPFVSIPAMWDDVWGTNKWPTRSN